MSDRKFPSQECLNFVENVRNLCYSADEPLCHISKSCGFYPQYLTQFFNYRGTNVPLDTAVRLSRYFDIPIEFLIEKDLGSGKRLVIVTDE